MQAARQEDVADELVGVFDGPDRDDGVIAQMGSDEDGLVVHIADDADAATAVQAVDLGVELGPERRIFDIVNGPGETVGSGDGQSAPLGSQMGMVVRSVVEIGDDVLTARRAEESSHGLFSFSTFAHSLSAAASCQARKPLFLDTS